MADIVTQKNIGAYIDPKPLSKPLVWTAAGTGDNATFTGLSIDRAGFATGTPPNSVDVDVYWSATLASGATLSLALDVQHSVDNSNWSDYTSQTNAVVATGISGGGQQNGITRLTVSTGGLTNFAGNNPYKSPGVDLSSAKRYIRVMVLPDLSSAGGDTAVLASVGVFGGFDTLAAPLT